IQNQGSPCNRITAGPAFRKGAGQALSPSNVCLSIPNLLSARFGRLLFSSDFLYWMHRDRHSLRGLLVSRHDRLPVWSVLWRFFSLLSLDSLHRRVRGPLGPLTARLHGLSLG